MSRDDLIYTAALMDGEGSVLLTQQHSPHRSPVASVPSTTLVLLKYLKKTFGGTLSKKRPSKAHHSKSWVWAVRFDNALQFLSAIFPYMKEPEKRRRVHLLLVGYKAITVRNGKYSPAQLRDKKKFEREFFRRSKKNTRRRLTVTR